ncbi:MAG: pyridoxal phosphate-dependent aminotransferase [Ilumatobacter sp.]|jgi:N-succinyldiaminopimelate aminotransferase|uniref:pyridoxal phosphate-dependent aminotransferase n=1 Tax=Ilumatobacter sp. TaxID=1967498 RepID=UPI00374F83D1|nr:pyridoxal phosphate-dependent aminotransferase [Ilumatobacter sp.]MBT5553451.1 pyridoxal phosphate-dependent aminotransferase [Ilumatobacter sp.]MBT7429918.1 pyridoxal phosphate-dependent aminotransferase [Ilumatobacter sp.]
MSFSRVAGRSVPTRTLGWVAAPTDVISSRLAGFGTTIFAEMSALAVETGAINLGQGFPDTDGPREVLDAAIESIDGGLNQYPPLPGMPILREAIAAHQQRFYDIELDPATEIVVTAGATEALAGALLGMLDAGDEVIVFEPMYDSYRAGIAMADARAVPVLLAPDANGNYVFDPAELRAAVSSRTKLVLLNTPHNPTGKVFTRDELQLIADVVLEHDLIAVTDEVYEHLAFDGRTHVPLSTLPGMAERTLTISSGGKTFHTTGWKIGWMSGPAPLVAAARTAKQFLTFVNGAPFQPAMAVGLGLPDSYFAGMRAGLQATRDRLVAALDSVGFITYTPEASYFVTADIRPLDSSGNGVDFCRQLPHRCGVVAVPNEVFYARPEHGRHMVRFAFCKQMQVIEAAADALTKGFSP